MRLSTHLAISHSVPVLVVTFAMALTLIALVRIGVVLTTLNDSELVILRDEGRLHQQAWALDVAMRHGRNACAADRPSTETGAEAARRIRREATALGLLLEEAAPGPMRGLAQGYLAVADTVLEGDPCLNLLGSQAQARRAELDERLTTVWVDRLGDLHAAVTAKEREARSTAVSATWTGIPLAAASFLLAMITARRMARIVNRPLAGLAAMAQRVGQGDFHTSVRIDGPSEVLALAGELDRMREQLQQLEALKQGFLASVSHELRTPLSKIRECLALMADGAVGGFEPKQARVIEIARSACERQIRLVTTLLDLSRLRAGSPIRIREGTSVDAVLQAAVEDERAEAAARNVRLELVAEGEIGPCSIDPVLVERAVANLIRNAVSVSKPGERVCVRRSMELDDPNRPGPWVRVSVSDQGPGVPAEIRDRVFEPFVTRSIPGTGKPLGIGLGLALAREVVRAHGGELELVEMDEPGSTFQMWLPVERSGAPEPVASVRAATLAAPSTPSAGLHT